MSHWPERVWEPAGVNIVLAVDPGTTQSGVVLWDGTSVIACGVFENGEVLELLDKRGPQHLALEMVASYGMAVGKETFRTVWWTGRFAERWQRRTSNLPMEVFRQNVKLHLCHTAKAKDTNIRAALLDRFGGKEAAIGRKATPGPLYGVSSHAWAALAVAVTAHDQLCASGARAA